MIHKFVKTIPEKKNLEQGVIYISLEYNTAIHLCCCGCSNEVVTPISPTDWKLSYNGKSISLYPSIGNWKFPCKSHYWIKNGEIKWAEKWSEKRIKAGKIKNRLEKEQYFTSNNNSDQDKSTNSLWNKFTRFIKDIFHFFSI